MDRKIRLTISFMVVFWLGLMVAPPASGQQYFDVRKYGARNDSTGNAGPAIKKAIEAASAAGGGTIFFPAGKYLTGPIHLKSNITVLISAGAELHFSDNFDLYLPMVKSRYEGVDVTSFSPFFYAYKAENITIKGEGLIDGHGKKWWDFVEGYKQDQPRSRWQLQFDALNKDILLPDDPKQMKRGFLRPPFIQPMYCTNVRIEGIKIRNSPFWTINPEFCDNVTIHGVTINNPHSPNTDGINPESCRNVHISDCHISVGDDCITIKSGKDAPGRSKAAPCENITITNCTMLSGHGGVVIGSEMSGGVKKVVISNCVFDGTDRGIRIKTARGRGGVVEDIRVSNIVMKNIRDQAIVLDMQYAKTTPEPLSERTPMLRNIHFSSITAQGKEAVYLNGLEEMPVSNISFTNMNFDMESGIRIRHASDITFDGVQVNVGRGAALHISDSRAITVNGLRNPRPLSAGPVIHFQDVADAYIYHSQAGAGTDVFLKLSGGQTKDITLGENNLKKARTPVLRDPGVPKTDTP
ncbi:glycoside hydrolase family 28 protein [Pedobacter sp. SYP-B3415]|uniref:glycoside hydrolase family 28 protein n=1 Tax=Pedobacter sp. SYP-B3415 TaxID=2496641 RepID=UPI001F0F3B89|nr:glycoside hydrolase family 28 protein [Pedobacter sp. SYP-B3415]